MADVATAEHTATTTLPRTPPQILGPFYPFMLTPTEGGNLTSGGQARGTILYLSGRILTEKGEPVGGAKVEIWQANAAGRYRHPNDENVAAPMDEKFSGFAVTTTDGRGAMRSRPSAPRPIPRHAANGARRISITPSPRNTSNSSLKCISPATNGTTPMPR